MSGGEHTAWIVPFDNDGDAEFSRNPIDEDIAAALDRVDAAFSALPRRLLNACLCCSNDRYLHHLEADDPEQFTDRDFWTLTTDLTTTLGSGIDVATFVPMTLRAIARGTSVDEYNFLYHLRLIPEHEWSDHRRTTVCEVVDLLTQRGYIYNIDRSINHALFAPMSASERKAKFSAHDGLQKTSQHNAAQSLSWRFGASAVSGKSRPGDDDREMTEVLADIKRLFETMPRANSMTGCPHCFSDEELRALATMHPDEFTDGRLWVVSFKITTTLGSAEDVSFFMYPIFRAAAGGGVVDLENFVSAMWRSNLKMSAEQQRAVRRFIDLIYERFPDYRSTKPRRKLQPSTT